MVKSLIDTETTGGAVDLGTCVLIATRTLKDCASIFSKDFSFTGGDRIYMLKRHGI